MRNISILFSSISVVVFLFGIALSLIVKDPVVMKFTTIVSVATILATISILSFAVESNESKIIRENDSNDVQQLMWSKLRDNERQVFDDISACERNFSEQIDSLWRKIDEIEDSAAVENKPRRK